MGQVPGGFAVSDSVAFEVSSTASFSGFVTIAFRVPGPISVEDFANLRILHNEGGALQDVTSIRPPRDYSQLTIYAQTYSFSPFYLVRSGTSVLPLFDQNRAYKAGSTIPVKFQLRNAGANISSATRVLSTRGLIRNGSSTASVVTDAGNSNPDSVFRYDSGLGGYVFNLSTKGLSPGSYVLSFSEVGQANFFYTVTFQVR